MARAYQRDIVGEWFGAVAELGEDATIRFGCVREVGADVEWSPLPHRRYDGVGGFAHLLRRNGHPSLADLPRLVRETTPLTSRILKVWARFAFARRPRWTWPALRSPGPVDGLPPAVAHRVFSRDETRDIVAEGKALGVTVNTLLLDRVSRVIRGRLAGEQREVAWMIPINMRGPVRLARDTANHSSFIDILAREGENEQILHRRIHGAIAAHQHWAFWTAFQWGRAFGRKGRRAFMAFSVRKKVNWVGSFSNLGSWDPPVEGDTPHAWVFCPPPVPTMPLCIGCVTYRGRLSLCLQLHPSLTTDQGIAQAWVDQMTSLLGHNVGKR